MGESISGLDVAWQLDKNFEWRYLRFSASNSAGSLLSQSLKLFEGARPVGAEQARERAVGEDAAVGLACGAVVGFVVGVADALDGRAAARAGEVEAAVHGHLRTEGGDLLGEVFFCLRVEAVDPELKRLACGDVEALPFVGC